MTVAFVSPVREYRNDFCAAGKAAMALAEAQRILAETEAEDWRGGSQLAGHVDVRQMTNSAFHRASYHNSRAALAEALAAFVSGRAAVALAEGSRR